MSTRSLVVPVDLGGSDHQTPLHPPARPRPTPELVRALIHHYESERRTDPHQSVEVAFFHGGLPGTELLQATGERPVRVACLPGDLKPAALAPLQHFGVRTIELDIGTHHTQHRRAIGRRLSGHALRTLACGLRDRGFRVGMVLSPGLPGTSHADALHDARWVVDGAAAQFVRLQPALAWRGTDSARWVGDGRWVPMTVGEAVTTLESMMDVFDEGSVEVARVGLQPGPDLAGRVVGGPVHPNLRALVEYRRFRRRMRSTLNLVPRQREAVLRVHPADLSWAKGQANANLRALRVELGLTALRVSPDATLERGTVALGRPIKSSS